MENIPRLSLTEGMQKTERDCEQQQGYIIGMQEQVAAQNRAEGRDTKEGRLCADFHGFRPWQGRDVRFHDFDVFDEL